MKHKKTTLEWSEYTHKRAHKCPDCGRLMLLKRVKRVVNKNSPEAKYCDFSQAARTGYVPRGSDVEFELQQFYCAKCGKYMFIDEMREYEKKMGIYKEGGKYDFLGFLFLVICFILIGVFTIYCILR